MLLLLCHLKDSAHFPKSSRKFPDKLAYLISLISKWYLHKRQINGVRGAIHLIREFRIFAFFALEKLWLNDLKSPWLQADVNALLFLLKNT